MDREEVLDSIKANVENQSLIKHMLATEAVMKALARKFNEDEEEWGLVGLMHDIDVELTEEEPESHGKLGAELAKELGASEAMSHAILCHNETHGIPCHSLLDKALSCTDPLTGLITAAALVCSDKRLGGLTTDSLKKRFKERRFAAGVNRERIALCQGIGLELEDFLALGLDAMKGITSELGL